MDPLTIAVAGGLRSRLQSLDLLANNLANATTSGYKSDREFYGVYTSADAESTDGNLTELPLVEKQWTDFAQGTLIPTGNQLDVALSGRGFLSVNGPSGPLYTRNGNLHLSSRGELTNSDGYTIRASGGGAIRVAPGSPFEIAKDGSVLQDGSVLAHLDVVDFPSTDPLKKVTGTCFQNAQTNNAPTTATDTTVEQGQLETSNVAVPEAAMRLVGVMRQFEMLQKAVSLGVEMNRKAIEEVARVGS